MGKYTFRFGGEFSHIDVAKAIYEYGRGRIDFQNKHKLLLEPGGSSFGAWACFPRELTAVVAVAASGVVEGAYLLCRDGHAQCRQNLFLIRTRLRQFRHSRFSVDGVLQQTQ